MSGPVNNDKTIKKSDKCRKTIYLQYNNFITHLQVLFEGKDTYVGILYKHYGVDYALSPGKGLCFPDYSESKTLE